MNQFFFCLNNKPYEIDLMEMTSKMFRFILESKLFICFGQELYKKSAFSRMVSLYEFD